MAEAMLSSEVMLALKQRATMQSNNVNNKFIFHPIVSYEDCEIDQLHDAFDEESSVSSIILNTAEDNKGAVPMDEDDDEDDDLSFSSEVERPYHFATTSSDGPIDWNKFVDSAVVTEGSYWSVDELLSTDITSVASSCNDDDLDENEEYDCFDDDHDQVNAENDGPETRQRYSSMEDRRRQNSNLFRVSSYRKDQLQSAASAKSNDSSVPMESISIQMLSNDDV